MFRSNKDAATNPATRFSGPPLQKRGLLDRGAPGLDCHFERPGLSGSFRDGSAALWDGRGVSPDSSAVSEYSVRLQAILGCIIACQFAVIVQGLKGREKQYIGLTGACDVFQGARWHVLCLLACGRSCHLGVTASGRTNSKCRS